jgi:hypothetical protein
MERGNGWSPLRETVIRKEEANKEEIKNKGKYKLNKYEQEYRKWHNKNINNTLNAFERDFDTDIEESLEKRGEFTVVSMAKEGFASFTNTINTNKGEIIGESNFKRLTKNWHFSEVVFNQLQLVMREAKKDIASFDLKNWRGRWLKNEATRSTVDLFLPAGINKHTFEKGSEGFLALAGTPTAQSKFYLPAQHQKALGQKEVTSITVELSPDEDIRFNITINYSYAKIQAKID